MNTTSQTKSNKPHVWLSTLVALALGSIATRADDNRAPEVPTDVAVDAGNKVHLHGFGIGFQIYTWDGTTWTGPVPDATLFDSDSNVVASHFAGPTWKSKSGSMVVGTAIGKATLDPTAIPWVKLNAATTTGPGIFAPTTFIQRVNTVGGRAPSVNGTVVGQVAKVPYTADYFFYRAE